MPSPLILAVDLISALVAGSLLHSTLKPCRESGVQHLLGIPAGFGLMAIAFAASTLEFFGGGLILDAIFLLIQTYGILFIALSDREKSQNQGCWGVYIGALGFLVLLVEVPCEVGASACAAVAGSGRDDPPSSRR